MFFYGYIDNGESFVKVKITADCAVAAYEKLEAFTAKLQKTRSDYSQVECVMLRDEKDDSICQSTDGDVDKLLSEYDSKQATLDAHIAIAETRKSELLSPPSFKEKIEPDL